MLENCKLPLAIETALEGIAAQVKNVAGVSLGLQVYRSHKDQEGTSSCLLLQPSMLHLAPPIDRVSGQSRNWGAPGWHRG